MTKSVSERASAREAPGVGKPVRRRLRRAVTMLLCVALGFALGVYATCSAFADGARRLAASHDTNALRIALQSYYRDFGRYPHDDIVPAGGTPEFSMSEVLVYSLGRAQPLGDRTTAGPFMSFGEGRLPDRDGDGFPEFVDPWGNPYLYACGDDGASYVIVSPGRDGKLGASMDPATGYRPASPYPSNPGEHDNVIRYGPPPPGPPEGSVAPAPGEGEARGTE
ncbi:MAG: hypothetical protein ACYTKD_08210 [Planctomycetota bacterium]|jgi:hypothetical protein